jgi:hypothetical protein
MNKYKFLSVIKIIKYNEKERFYSYCRSNYKNIINNFIIHYKRVINKQFNIKLYNKQTNKSYLHLELFIIRYNELYVLYNSFVYKFNNYIKLLQFIRPIIQECLHKHIYKHLQHLVSRNNKIFITITNKTNNVIKLNTVNITCYNIIHTLTKRVFQ